MKISYPKLPSQEMLFKVSGVHYSRTAGPGMSLLPDLGCRTPGIVLLTPMGSVALHNLQTLNDKPKSPQARKTRLPQSIAKADGREASLLIV